MNLHVKLKQQSYLQFPGKPRRFSLFVNSAVTKQTLKLQCRPSCAGLELAAGMSPDDEATKTWKATAKDDDPLIVLSLKDKEKALTLMVCILLLVVICLC